MIPRIAMLAALFLISVPAPAQTPAAYSAGTVPLEVTLGYSTDRTNGVVGGRGCFWMQGGKAEASAYFGRGVSVVSELAGERADSINSAGESLSFVSYLFGPRYSLGSSHSRFVPFAQFLVGGVHGFDALFPGYTGAPPDALAFAAGGGLNMRISHRFALRVVQADYLQTQLPNDGNNRQNHLRISGGVVLRFGESRR
jgi:outer membrane immunogenic protein